MRNVLAAASLLVAVEVLAASPRELALGRVSLDLPGAPSIVIPADLDGDGAQDLLIVIAYTEWGSVSEDRIENLVQFVEVVPALFDQREARAWLGNGRGGYEPLTEPMPLPPSVLSVEAGPPSAPILALTDEGVSVMRVSREGGRPTLVLEPKIQDPPVLAGAGTFVPELGMVHDLDGDGDRDLLLPASDGAAVYLWHDGGFGTGPVQRVALPGDQRVGGRRTGRIYPLVTVRDLDGDRRVDLVSRQDASGIESIHWMKGEGNGRFGAVRPLPKACLIPDPPITPSAATLRATKKSKAKKTGKEKEQDLAKYAAAGDLAYLGDIDGDGTIEAVLESSLDTDDGLDEAREPHSVLAFYRASSGLVFEREPYAVTEIVGHAFGGSWPAITDEGFRDLDGDGRLDLVTVTLDFSVLQVVRVLATKKISIGVDFHVWSQGSDGIFRQVEGLDLSETLRLDLNDVKLSRFAQFSGDFDGDGRVDFIHLGRGKEVTIHRGNPGSKYAKKPDLSIELAEEPKDLALVRVTDLDGDGRSDLAVTRPLTVVDPGASTPVRLDLYLSGAQP